MNCKLSTEEYDGHGLGRNHDFRMVENRFYAGVWYEKGSYLPVDISKDTKNEYCIRLSPTCSYLIDKLLLSDWTQREYLSWTEYQKAVENDWVNFDIRTHEIRKEKLPYYIPTKEKNYGEHIEKTIKTAVKESFKKHEPEIKELIEYYVSSPETGWRIEKYKPSGSYLYPDDDMLKNNML